ncbi:MAG: hypothetical protein MI923_03770 [Phycisphaerales bacterium]|nr:hypothetical protein [Phycisphaerales bacterium]
MHSNNAPIRQSLNAADCLMLSAHNSLREIGHSGFHCQTHLWLRQRLDVGALKNALSRLSLRYPVITSRLVEHSRENGPYWQSRPGAQCKLHEASLDRSDTNMVWQYASDLFATPLDHDRIDPAEFHLLHLPDGRDVLLMRFSHVLMDGKAPELVLKEIEYCLHTQGIEAKDEDHPHKKTRRPHENGDEMATHLNGFKRLRRYRAALRVVSNHLCLPARSVTLAPSDTSDQPMDYYGVDVRSLDESQTKTIIDRATRLCGFTNLTPTVLASVFRAVSRLASDKQNKRSCFQTDVPLTLRPPGKSEPVFHNIISFIQMNAKESDIDDRDHLTQVLHSQMRNQLRRHIDLGNLQMMTALSRHRWLLRKYIVAHIRKHPFTLDFCFMGPVAEGLEQFCGRTVDWLYTLNTTTSPRGVALQVNLFRDRMNLVMTYISKSMPKALASTFLDTITEDLLDD